VIESHAKHAACAEEAVGAVVLAAGGSRRMGQPKLLIRVGEEPMVRWASRAACAAALAEVVVVTGAAAEQMREALAGLPVRAVHNPRWEEGIGTSIGVGIRALSQEVKAALIVLADHPDLSTGVIDQVVRCFRSSGSPIVVPTWRGQRGHPVLFARAMFDDLLRLEGDRGARQLLDRPGAEVSLVEIDDASIVEDIDTWEEYTRARDKEMER